MPTKTGLALMLTKWSLGASAPRCVVLAFFVATSSAAAQTAVASRTRAHVETLASERFGGREAGSDGERLAGAYIAAQLARVGAKPLPGRSDMFQPFEFTAGSRDGGSAIDVRYTPVAGTESGTSGNAG